MVSASHLLTAVDVAGQSQENNEQFDPSWMYILLRFVELVDMLIPCLQPTDLTTAE